MDISKSSATAELRGVGMFRRHRAPPAHGADITQVMAFVDDYLAEEERAVKSDAARDPYAARLKAASLTACRGAWEFLKAVGQARARRDMLDVANSIAASRPELAARLRKAAREGWAE
jgi:hypothetical protein